MKDGSDARDVHRRIARRVRELRAERGQSLDALATHCGVSRSMISLIERGEASPTAVVLEKLATGLGVMLADLFAEPGARDAQPLARRRDQAEWRDPQSGYLRRNLSPAAYPSPLQLVEVEFPAGARVAYESGPRDVAIHQQIWLIAGTLHITLGDTSHELAAGDCLAMRLDRPIVFSNPGRRAARYLVAITTDTHVSRRTA
ncbi:helix-turn-helix domain-containing protein [Aquabacterium humicola]|uniref:helix-turn-helix domain-containing protein n=1 Tax=Aquabacterium humicola TaxID=3237377 RepID=UPI0025434EEF|nr:helix-turn-helix domain-containing protein [Rubrivivax pictus]